MLTSDELAQISRQINNVSVVSYLVPIVVGVWRWHSLDPLYRTRILLALLTLLSVNVLSEVGRHVWHNNIVFTYLIIWFETLFLTLAYCYALHNRRNRRIIQLGFYVFVLIGVGEYLFLRGPKWSQTYAHMAQTILLVGAALFYFEQILHELRNIRLERDPMFLVSIGVIFYYTGSLIVFALEDPMSAQHLSNEVWIMYNIQFILLIAWNILNALALYYAKGQKSEAVALPLC